jgi:hypothetical protein
VYRIHLLVRKIRTERSAAIEKNWADLTAQFGILPERRASDTPFKEEPFGNPIKPGMYMCEASENHTRDVSSIVVSLALFDGDFTAISLRIFLICILSSRCE